MQRDLTLTAELERKAARIIQKNTSDGRLTRGNDPTFTSLVLPRVTADSDVDLRYLSREFR
jgi:hypothetical protein